MSAEDDAVVEQMIQPGITSEALESVAMAEGASSGICIAEKYLDPLVGAAKAARLDGSMIGKE